MKKFLISCPLLTTLLLFSCGQEVGIASQTNSESVTNQIDDTDSTITTTVDSRYQDYPISQTPIFVSGGRYSANAYKKAYDYSFGMYSDLVLQDTNGNLPIAELISEYHLPDQYVELQDDEYLPGDKFLFTHYWYSKDIEGSFTIGPHGEEEYGSWGTGTFISVEYIKAEVVELSEDLITRNQDGYIQSVDFSGFNGEEIQDKYAKEYTREKDYVITPTKWTESTTSKEYYTVKDLNKYNGKLYATVQDNILFALYSFNPREC